MKKKKLYSTTDKHTNFVVGIPLLLYIGECGISLQQKICVDNINIPEYIYMGIKMK